MLAKTFSLKIENNFLWHLDSKKEMSKDKNDNDRKIFRKQN